VRKGYRRRMIKMGKWLNKGSWKSKKEAMKVLATFRRDYKRAGIPIREIRVRKKGKKYVLQQWFD